MGCDSLANKRFYWLKLKEDFFQQKAMKKLRRMDRGETLTIVYLKMQLASLRNGGVIAFDGFGDSVAEELSLQIDELESDVRVTVEFLIRYGLMEPVDGEDAYILPGAVENTGSEGDSAARMRALRTRSTSHCDDEASKSDTASHCDDRKKKSESDKEKEKESSSPRARAEDGDDDKREFEILRICSEAVGKIDSAERGMILTACAGLDVSDVQRAVNVAKGYGARSAKYLARTIQSQREKPERSPKTTNVLGGGLRRVPKIPDRESDGKEDVNGKA